MHLQELAQKCKAIARMYRKKAAKDPSNHALANKAIATKTRMEAILQILRRHHGAVIVLPRPEAGAKRLWANPAVNPPRKVKAIGRLPRKLANARRRLARKTANCQPSTANH